MVQPTGKSGRKTLPEFEPSGQDSILKGALTGGIRGQLTR
ncbi:hypothetical protein VRK_16500 [Vibrio sp. MEBiC08052]|nr:hypothetical protein VRK_16500 [Vibrio sp. MEBiC08052]